MSYEPQVGDRVRVTDVVEGEVTEVDSPEFWIGSTYVTQDAGNWKRTIEKVTPPEPEWRNGDVIKVGVFIPAYRINGHWLTCDGEPHRFDADAEPYLRLSLSDEWTKGRVTVIHKEESC